MKMTTERLLLANLCTGRSNTACVQHVRTGILVQHHYDFVAMNISSRYFISTSGKISPIYVVGRRIFVGLLGIRKES
jgi:hypothetical protein